MNDETRDDTGTEATTEETTQPRVASAAVVVIEDEIKSLTAWVKRCEANAEASDITAARYRRDAATTERKRDELLAALKQLDPTNPLLTE